MPTFFCTSCWADLHTTKQRCPCCGADSKEFSARPYLDKLLAALRHPEPLTVRRVIYILGERRETRAVEALSALYEDSTDPFVQSDIVKAMGRIRTPEAMNLVRRAAGHPSFLVKEAAQNVLIQVSDC